MNFLALLGWAPDGETTIMSRRRADRAVHARACEPEPGAVRLREARLDERRVHPRAHRRTTSRRAARSGSASRATTGTPSSSRKAAPLVQEKIQRLGEFPAYARLPLPRCAARSGRSRRRRAGLRGGARGARRAGAVHRRSRSRRRSAASLEQLGLKPRQGFQPIRVAVTGSKVSPGLFESIELLGRERRSRRLERRRFVANDLARSGSSARWNPPGAPAELHRGRQLAARCVPGRRARSCARVICCRVNARSSGTATQLPPVAAGK